jgi:hypothetical protein
MMVGGSRRVWRERKDGKESLVKEGVDENCMMIRGWRFEVGWEWVENGVDLVEGKA